MPSSFIARSVVVLCAAAIVGCGSSDSQGGSGEGASPEDQAVEVARGMVQAFLDGDAAGVCEAISDSGEKAFAARAAAREYAGPLDDCEGQVQFFREGTSDAKLAKFQVNGEPNEVDVDADEAKVSWDCCTFYFEEVAGELQVINAGDLGLYFG